MFTARSNSCSSAMYRRSRFYRPPLDSGSFAPTQKACWGTVHLPGSDARRELFDKRISRAGVTISQKRYNATQQRFPPIWRRTRQCPLEQGDPEYITLAAQYRCESLPSRSAHGSVLSRSLFSDLQPRKYVLPNTRVISTSSWANSACTASKT